MKPIFLETNLQYLIRRAKSFFKRLPTEVPKQIMQKLNAPKGIRVGLTEAEVIDILETPPTKIMNAGSSMTYWSWENGDRIAFRAGIVDEYDLHGGTAPVSFPSEVKQND